MSVCLFVDVGIGHDRDEGVGVCGDAVVGVRFRRVI